MRTTARFLTSSLALLAASLLLPQGAHAQQGVRGDVDGDGRVTAADARLVMDFLAGRALPSGVSVLPGGDADGNGRITGVDAAIINGYAAGRDMSRYPVGRGVAPGEGDGLAMLLCQGSVQTRTVSCRAPGGVPGGANADVIVGGQNLYVTLASNDIQVVADTFMFDVTVTNLVVQPMGLDSAGGVDGNGVRVFFHNGPVATLGVMEVVNQDGDGTFTGGMQPFFAYADPLLGGDGMLATGETSGEKRWKLTFTEESSFTFQLYVSAPFRYPRGWVDLYPRGSTPIGPEAVPVDTVRVGESRQLEDTVRTAVGTAIPGQSVTWSSTGPAVTVDGTGLVTGAAIGLDSVVAETSSPLRRGKYLFQVVGLDTDSTEIEASPDSVAAGDTSTVMIQLRDNLGRIYPLGGQTVVFFSDHGTLSGQTDHANGTHSAKLTWDSTGVVIAGAVVNGDTVADSVSVVFQAGAPATLERNSADPQSAEVTTAVAEPPSVIAKDGLGNPVAGVVVVFAVTGGGGQISDGGAGTDSVEVTTNIGGIATLASWTMGTGAGTDNNTVEASTGALTPLTFTASAAPGVPANLAKTAGDAQSDTVAKPVAVVPQVLVTDVHGNPVPGVGVTFAVGSGGTGAAVADGGATTNATGHASPTSWTLGQTAGTNNNTITASSTGLTTVTFTASAINDVPADIVKTAGDNQTGTAGVALAIAPQVTLLDQFNNLVPNVEVTFDVVNGGGSVTGATPTSNGTGVATVGSWAPGSSGLNRLRASVSIGTAAPDTFTALVPPVANTDSSQAMGNTTLGSAVAPNVLANDQSPNGGAISITTVGAIPTARGGTVTLAGDGTFSYLPPAGNVLRDSAQYTINDTYLSANGWIKLRFVGKVWYVDNTFGGAADGRDISPYTSVAAAEAVAAVNDSILVRTGSGTTAGGTLKNGQLLRGQGHSEAFTASLNGISVTLLGTGTRPDVGGLVLGSGNSIRGMRIVNVAGAGLTGASIGTLSLGEISVHATGGPGLDLSTGTVTGNGGTGAAVLDSLRSTNSATHGLAMSTVAGTLTIQGGTASSIGNPTQAAVNITNGNPVVTFTGTISKTNASFSGINITGLGASGSVNFTGPSVVLSTGSSNAINLTTLAGSVSFTDSVKITTTGGIGVNASGGGSLTIAGANNSVSSGNTAVNVLGTAADHLAGSLSFRSVSSSTGTKGASVQFLDGAVSITGDDGGDGIPDSGTSGGTIIGSDARGIELINVDGPIYLGGITFTAVADGTEPNATVATGNCGSVASGGSNTGCNAALHLDTVADVTLRRLTVNGSGQMGINGNRVTNLSVTDVAVNNAGTSEQEDGIRMYNLSGTGGMTNVSIVNPWAMGFHISNTAVSLGTGAAPFLITNSTFQNSFRQQGLVVHTAIGGTAHVKYVGGSITGNFSAAIQTANDPGNTGTLGIYVDGTSFSNNAAAALVQGGGGTTNFDIRNITQVSRPTGVTHSIMIKGDNAGVVTGNLISNTIGSNVTPFSGTGCPSGCSGISLDARNTSRITAFIRGNTIQDVGDAGIDIGGGQGSSKVEVTATGNLIRLPDALNGLAGIYANSGVLNADSNCFAIQIGGTTAWPGAPSATAAEIQNRIEGSWPSGSVRVIKSFGASPPDPIFHLPLYDGSGVNAWITARNSITGTAVTSNAGAGGAFTGGTSCP